MSLNILKSSQASGKKIDKEIIRHFKVKRDNYDKKSKDWLRVHNAMVDHTKGYYTHEINRILQEDLKKATGDEVLKYRKWIKHLNENKKT